jgi:hypothetical protein
MGLQTESVTELLGFIDLRSPSNRNGIPPKEFLQGSPGMYAKVRKFEARAKPAAALDTLTDLP